MKIFNRLADQFKKVQPLPEGLYHLQADEKPMRVHLRLRKDGTGLLILNASTILQLNTTAAEYAYHYIKGTSPEQAAKEIAARYRIPTSQAQEDYTDFVDRIRILVESPDLDPVSFLDFERVAPHSADLSAPLRLDCALTYRVPAGTQPDVAPTKRVDRELTTDEWRAILDKAWQAGIPHVTFTGGEPTLREDLPDLIAHAEKLGMVCGLLTDGAALADKTYLEKLLQTGLDHILLTLHPEDESVWKSIVFIVDADIFLTVHLTVNEATARDGVKTVERLAKSGVGNLSLSTSDPKFIDNMRVIENKASALNLSLHWDLPVPYSDANSVTMEIEDDEVPAGAGRAWLYVEPDGDVLPAQGEADKVMGNLLKDPWEKIYK
jgi:organic radical activating enzyme